jgi:AAA15 family ATPase/GTPase
LLSFFAALYDYKHINNIITWFENTTVINYGDSLREWKFDLPFSDRTRAIFYDLLHAMGISINDIEIQQDSNGKTESIYSVYSYHDKDIRVDFPHESSGTRKVISLIRPMIEAIVRGVPLFIDELDAKLHPKLLEVIISLYTNKEINKKGAQLIFTSHDLYTLDKKFLRRDEIWFVAKRDDYSSHLYSLSDFAEIGNEGNRSESDEGYAKLYTEGRYGADPYFQRIENWVVEQ